MFTLILVYLLFPVCGSKANTGSSALKKECQSGNFCITLRKGELTAEAGLCVVIPCSFTTDSYFETTDVSWSHCQTKSEGCVKTGEIFNSRVPGNVRKQEFKGRVSLLESDVSQRNCSIIINDLRKSDSGRYNLRVVRPTGSRLDGYTFKKGASLSVKDLTQKPTVMVPPLTEGQQTTLSCTAPGLCSGSAPGFTWMWGGGGQNESNIKINIKTDHVSAIEQRHSSSLTFTPSAELHDTNITCKVIFKNHISTDKTETLEVTYVKDPVISGERVLKLGDALNLTCSVDSFPPSVVVTWTKLGSNQTLKNDTRTAKLIIPEMTAEDVGKYICTASQQSTNQTARTEVNVKILPIILNSSTCELQSEILTCVCVSQGFPLPTIEWPLLENHTHYSFTTTVSKNTVNVTTSVKDHNYTTVMCLSKNEFGKVTEDLEVVIKNVTKSELVKEGLTQNLSEKINKTQVIIAFLIGLLLSAVVCCTVQKCRRKNRWSSQNSLEMIDVDPALVSGGGAEADEEQREVEYANINFDLLKRGRPVGAERSQETTEYAEIKKDKVESKQDKNGESAEVVEEERKDNVAEKKEEKEEKEKKEEEKEALYSNVMDLKKEDGGESSFSESQ